LTACTAENPVGPAIDPLNGKWLGTIVDPYTGETKDNSLTLTVMAGGIAHGTGYMWYHFTSDDGFVAIILMAYFEAEVSADGSLRGVGRSIYVLNDYSIMSSFIMYGEGSVTGSLNSAAGTGSGKLTIIEEEEGSLDIDWTVTKEGPG
jgi:hypothetical protein